MSDTAVVIATFASPVEAEIARTQLEEQGVACRLDDINTVSTDPLLGAAVGGIKLRVPADQAERASKVLEEQAHAQIIDEEWDDFEDDEADDRLVSSALTCPKCHSQDIGFGKMFHAYWSVVIVSIISPMLAARMGAGPLGRDIALALPAILTFVGVWATILRIFPLRCKECGAQGKRRLFRGNTD